MGQLLMPKYLTKFSRKVVGILILLLLVELNTVNGQNCEFDTEVEYDSDKDVYMIVDSPVSENTPSDEIIWDVRTKNIDSSQSSTVPHGRYLTGLRYTSRYVYKTSEAFNEFINTERTTVVQRNVTFTCQDKETMKIHFKFPLEDENEAPEFIQVPSVDLQVNLADVREDTVINENNPITVRDRDFSDAFNTVTITSDRRELIIPEWVVEDMNVGVGKFYRVKLKLNLTEDVPVGRYSLNLICSDGHLTNSTRLGINIFNSKN